MFRETTIQINIRYIAEYSKPCSIVQQGSQTSPTYTLNKQSQHRGHQRGKPGDEPTSKSLG